MSTATRTVTHTSTGTLAPLLPGTVALVGGGPGEAGLMTVAGRAAVEQADVLLVDHLAPSEALGWAPSDAEIVDVGKLPREAFTPQESINALLVQHARAGRRVVRLKGGDGFVFGRGMEELEACAQAEVSVRVIPGVTSSVAVPALGGIPVTHRGLVQGFSVISGHVPPGHPDSTLDFEALARSGTTLVVLMGVATLSAITAALVANGLDPATPAAVVARGGHPDQQVVGATVADIAARAAHVEPPAITVIGHVAAFAATDTPVLEEVI
ncbi:uroporphyrinogen-III C-methyltransferase [Nocardioides seonyuensis]|uniref:uroporphyrinogen-III C-methyltransferase n=1 Tax=Nocardioides seonyuensis TaxID=2518371 RepID=A0A4P7IHX2_9ACTN|nr:uroporphyrinogen-III C-methyltransferase [Nocardioides seonyuensis]QBX56928.1 uroporphyrinogen-III C-methyltransferase [Nocardioides seonyuensis]